MTAKATGGALLLVEDDDSIGRLVKQYLEQQDGWHVVWRRTGEEALVELRLFHRRHFLRRGEMGVQGTVVRLNGALTAVTFASADEHRDYLAKTAVPTAS